MPAENTGPALLDGSHDMPLLWRQRVRQAEVGTVLAEDVCYLELRPAAHVRSGLTVAASSSSGLSVARTVFSET